MDDLHEEEVVYSPEGVVLILCHVAYREFEKTPRKKARTFLNRILSLARQNGLKTKKTFADFIGNNRIEPAELTEFVSEIFLYINGEEFFGLWQLMAPEE